MIIYEGPSELDGKPIVAIITGLVLKSKNSKTGVMPQIWILRSDIHPTDALRTGEDKSICGDCKFRPKVLGEKACSTASRECYVKPMAFNQIYKKYINGGYDKINPQLLAELLRDKHVRIGAYGDPGAIKLEFWETILKYCKSTGYTHAWKYCDEGFNKYCMASCDSPLDVKLATLKGYRCFFVQDIEAIKVVNDIKLAYCPASKEMGKKTTCFNCMACTGTRFGQKSHITIMKH